MPGLVAKFFKQTRFLRTRVRKSFNTAKKIRRQIQSAISKPNIEAQPLRLELFSLEQLERHAKSLAALHGVGKKADQDQLLLRLTDNENALLQAYENLNAALEKKQQISPAGEWLLDNFHLIEEQIRIAKLHLPKGYSRELPHLNNTTSTGFPRVYEIALQVIAHADGRVDQENIKAFVASYQKVTLLKLGELWAIPIMLRLALIENLRRVSTAVIIGMQDRDKANEWADRLISCAEQEPKNLILVTADMARTYPPISNSFVAEFVRRLHGQGTGLEIPLAWMEQQLVEKGSTTEQIVQLEGQQQAANQVSVGASIASLRFLSSVDWRDFVESLSSVEQELLLDPAGIYPKMDFVTRDRYRHIVEELSKRSILSETEVARKVVNLARSYAPSGERKLHIGYFLIDKGLPLLESMIAAKYFLPLGLRRFDPSVRILFYFGGILATTLAITGAILSIINPLSLDRFILLFLVLVTMICASQVSVTLANWLATLLVKPSLLPRLDFTKGIPADCRTLVVVPTLLSSESNTQKLLEALEVRYLANREENLLFGLLTDFTDARLESLPNDSFLVRLASEGIQSLNAKYKTSSKDIFFLFHRAREWNPRDKIWMGYERKRGKLEALNALLLGAPSTFSKVVGNTDSLSNTKYVITLDTDTQLPRDSAQLLVSTMAHVLNIPFYDSAKGRVTEGYSILQPRVAVSLPGSRKSWFVRLYSSDTGIDPYTRAVSDVYQDLFLEGSFIGKGIYDVKAFNKALKRVIPKNLILSHDLLEGSYAKCGLVSDVVLYEEFPSHYGVDMMRRHRWIRGDWQIFHWLLPFAPDVEGRYLKNAVPLLSKWKIFDNLRRSLVPIAYFLFLITTWISWDRITNPESLTAVLFFLIFLPPVFTSLAEILRKPSEAAFRPHLYGVIRTGFRQLIQALLTLIFLVYESFMCVDAILRSIYRMAVTRKFLLQWESASDPRNSVSTKLIQSCRSMCVAPLFSIVVFAAVPWSFLISRWPAIPLLVAWFFSPVVAFWLSRPIPREETRLGVSEIDYLHRLARKTWRFFETFVGPEDHWLPPDNFQEYPVAVVAHRTSPTNMGLSLVANLTAYDFGYISRPRLIERTSKALATMELMERYRGHFYNWYDTLTLKPLLPHYVSTVDSGNLAGFLLTLKQGLYELPDESLISTQTFRGLRDTLDVLADISGKPEMLQKCFAELEFPPQTLRGMNAFLQRMLSLLPELRSLESQEERWWIAAFESQCRTELQLSFSLLSPLIALVPPPQSLLTSDHTLILELRDVLEKFDRIPSLNEALRLGRYCVSLVQEIKGGVRSQSEEEDNWLNSLAQVAGEIERHAAGEILLIDKLAEQCEKFSLLEYDFLYDKSRKLLSIGYNVSDYRRDAGFYDLLASEARLCSFVAIAQGSLPQEHWFSLGRMLTTLNNESTLLSWSGSMFEYLMPLLVMPTFKNTLLDETYSSAVERQIEYGKEHGVPWGISESGYNTTDVHLNYQYRAFGVPGLGFKRGLAEDLVIAPYATLMALMVKPHEAYLNLKQMKTDGYEGLYGFYEAIDFTPSRLASNQKCAIVKSYMAHHEGMSILSLAYYLLDRKMQKRFQSDPRFQATELLLHERVPKVDVFYPHAPEVAGILKITADREATLRVINTPHTPRPEVHLLSNGRYTVMVTNAGGGYSRWKDLSLTRWREDPTSDNWGTFCYLRDLSTGDVWSAAYQPTLKNTSHYEAIFPQARAEFRRRDHNFEMHTEIAVSPEDDIEVRRISITNLSTERKTLEFTTYAEVVMVPQAADEAHPAFSNLFLQTDILPERHAILCSRRARSEKEKTPTLFHLVTLHGSLVGQFSYETDRSKFIGRGRTVSNPVSMETGEGDGKLSGSEGSVLDPIVAIRCRIVIEPKETARVHVVTGIGETQMAALRLIEKYHERHASERVFELAWTHRQVVLRQLNISEWDAQLYAQLASSILYANPLRRASSNILSMNRRGQSGLWGYGISGDLPIILLRIEKPEDTEIVKQLVQAHGYWRMMGLAVDLVIWNEDQSGYRQELQDQILSLIAAGTDVHQIDKPGGIFVRRAEQMSEEDRILLQTVARAILKGSGGSLADQIDVRRKKRPFLAPFVATKSPSFDFAGELTSRDLLFKNGLGGFSTDGSEYVITTSPGKLTPAPWSNVLANPHFGTVVSESGSAYTWCENAHEFRLTPWQNDALCDGSGEAFYLRDEETGEFWSPTPLPARAESTYVTRHGFGYSVFELNHNGIFSELTTFVAIDAPIKVALIKLRNVSGRQRRLSVTGYCEWVLGELRGKSLMHIVSEKDPISSALFARNPYHPEFGGRIGFFNLSESQCTVTGDRSEFLGRNGTLAKPAAMERAQLSGTVGASLDACAAMQTIVELQDGQEHELVCLLGVARDVDDARILLRRFLAPASAHAALGEVRNHWKRNLGAVQISTPDPSLNILANGWLIYQVLASRMWARSGYYQSGGAFGFRDQLQDAMALLHSEPKLLREHLLRCASRQYREGDVQHWWHPPSGRGVRTHFSDDYLWLPLATSRYVMSIGDTGVLQKRIHFIEGRQVNLNEEAYTDLPKRSDESATLYEHCVRSITHALKFGTHGLPLMGCGDWNDGMNLVGEHGKGESVWLAFFLYDVLTQFSKVSALIGDSAFSEFCLENAKTLQENIELNGWDGEWYRRAYFDNGEALGSASNLECQIDSLPQSWAVLSGAGNSTRTRAAMEAVDNRLVDRKNGLVKLFDPPFDKTELNPGYIKGYVPGVRENGGQYTHAAIWTAMAFSALGDKKRTWELISLINPLKHGDTAEKIANYKVEPYVIAADVYAVAPHTGRGGWTWYTGSAGWMYRLILESLLGLKLVVDKLYFAPCVPVEWKEFSIRYRYRETFYDISVSTAAEPGEKVSIILDGIKQTGEAIVLIDDHRPHIVKVQK